MSDNNGGVGSEIAKKIPSWAVQFKGGCNCKNFQKAMDDRGPYWCEANFDYLVNHFMSQGDHLIPLLQRMPTFAMKVAITHTLRAAIAKVKARNAKKVAEQEK